MSRSQHIGKGFSGIAWFQLGLITTQFVYSYFTARLFSPESFGAFTIILSLQGIAILINSSGIASYILRIEQLDSGSIKNIRFYALRRAVGTTALFVIVSPFWMLLLNAESEAFTFIPLMACAIFIAPFASIESSLLRREGRVLREAFILFVATVSSFALSLFVGFTTRLPISLAIVALAVPAITGLACLIFRSPVLESNFKSNPIRSMSYIRKVSGQHLIFLIINQFPIWAIGTLSGPSDVGYFARATVLTQLLGNKIAEAMTRPLQPFWRHLQDESIFLRGFIDALRIAGTFSFTFFGLMFFLGPALSRFWLGPGWEIAADLVKPLSLLAAFAVPFTVLANSLEMRGELKILRNSQYVSLALIVSGCLGFFLERDLVLFVYALAVAQASALFYVLWSVSRKYGFEIQRFFSPMVEPALWALINLSAVLGILEILKLARIFEQGDAPSTFFGLALGIVTSTTLLRFQKVLLVLQSREMSFPKWLVKVIGLRQT
jgi:O-antigen/teichoic acid export membrane protein